MNEIEILIERNKYSGFDVYVDGKLYDGRRSYAEAVGSAVEFLVDHATELVVPEGEQDGE